MILPPPPLPSSRSRPGRCPADSSSAEPAVAGAARLSDPHGTVSVRRRLHQLPLRPQSVGGPRAGLQSRRVRRGLLQLPVGPVTRRAVGCVWSAARTHHTVAVGRLHRGHARGDVVVGGSLAGAASSGLGGQDDGGAGKQQCDLRSVVVGREIGQPFQESRVLANKLLARWRPYQEMERGIIPSDALAEVVPAGIPPYFVPDLKFIDSFGLTDTTIVRNPVTHQSLRAGHSRQPPPRLSLAAGGEFQGVPGGRQCGGSSGTRDLRRAGRPSLGDALRCPQPGMDRRPVRAVQRQAGKRSAANARSIPRLS